MAVSRLIFGKSGGAPWQPAWSVNDLRAGTLSAIVCTLKMVQFAGQFRSSRETWVGGRASMREFLSRSALVLGVSSLAVLSGCYGFASTSGRHTLPSGLTTPVQGTPPGGLAIAPVGTAQAIGRLYADVDRNGKIDGNDDANRDQWSGARG